MQLLRLVLLIAVCLIAEVLCAETISPNDPRVNLLGRWSVENSTSPWCAWQGSSFATEIIGTNMSAVFSSRAEEYVRVIVDGDDQSSTKLRIKKGTHKQVLVSGLNDGRHRVQVVKETYLGRGRLTLRQLESEGRFLPISDVAPRLRIVYFGDSNLAGHSLEHERNRGESEFVGCHFTFAGIASRMLDADYQNISVSGAVISGRPNSVLTFIDRVDRHTEFPKWDHQDFPADICVLNVGANDISWKSSARIKSDYLLLLRELRKRFSDAHIVMMNGYGWARNEPANFTQEVLDEFGDKNCSRCVFPWFFNEWHGCEYDHSGMAHDLVQHLGRINAKWEARNLAGVFDGFADRKGFANWSFEAEAPFGGFGWRYLQSGTDRVKSESAQHGEYYVRLAKEQEIHQPCPVQPGEKVCINLFARKSSPSARKCAVRVSVEFRDQEWRHSIGGASRDSKFELGETWQQYSFEFQAPPAHPDERSRDPWQFVLRLGAEYASVDVDSVTRSVK